MQIYFGRFFVEYDKGYEYDLNAGEYYLVGVFSIGFPTVAFEPDYAHLEWLSQVWGFQWHRRLFDKAPF